MKKVKSMLENLRILKGLSRLFVSKRTRRDRDAAELFLDVNDANETGEALDTYFEFIEADPENAQAMRDLNAVWEALPDLKHPPYPNAEELAQNNSWGWLSISLPLAPAAAIAASLAVAGILASNVFFSPPAIDDIQEIAFSTERGETRPLTLEDGSTVTLGGSSQITVALSEKERNITLVSGDSFMDVAHDQSRAFVVRAGSVTVRAIGTAFSVNKHSDGVSVAVSEGIVEVLSDGNQDNSAIVNAGEQLKITAGGDTNGVIAIDMENIATWRRGELILDDETLAYAVDVINRYYNGRILLTDSRLETMRASGVIDIYEPGAWLNSLQSVLPVDVQQNGENTYHLAYEASR